MEGLPCVRKIVTALTDAAPVILFSAAVPGQGGNNHINEQWPEYWCQLFKALGYDVLDPIRPRIREDQSRVVVPAEHSDLRLQGRNFSQRSP